jgi:hypothetical protein
LLLAVAVVLEVTAEHGLLKVDMEAVSLEKADVFIHVQTVNILVAAELKFLAE